MICVASHESSHFNECALEHSTRFAARRIIHPCFHVRTRRRELVYTARKLPAAEALSCGLVSRVLPDAAALQAAAYELAAAIAAKSHVAVQGSKVSSSSIAARAPSKQLWQLARCC
jgi:enoyl-CoA hydratase/carnithine racemase